MSFKYRVKVVKVGNKTPKDAIVNEAAFHSFESQETTSDRDFSHTIPKNKLERNVFVNFDEKSRKMFLLKTDCENLV